MPSWNEKTWLMVILLSGVCAMALSWWLQVSPARTQLHQLHQDHHTLLKNIAARQHQFLDLRAQNTAITDLSSDFTPAFSPLVFNQLPAVGIVKWLPDKRGGQLSLALDWSQVQPILRELMEYGVSLSQLVITRERSRLMMQVKIDDTYGS
ncbi:hypothetical protein TUM12370_03260 [Salmonella enterica subsp. enterica serovar Choleraesuis]|nr:hypothetical protein TUM12370_03260 [Salmonella enterica subsp. enterica serovar Choleraesuis]